MRIFLVKQVFLHGIILIYEKSVTNLNNWVSL